MKITHLPSLSLCLSLSVGYTMAADQTWIDANANNNWNTSDPNWNGGVVWVNGNDAIFGGTGETVTLTEGVTVGDITFSAVGYDIAGGGNSITLSSPSTITANNDATISAVMTGGGGLTKEGGGLLTLGALNNYTGDTIINNGTVNMTGAGGQAIHANSAITVGTGATLKYSGGVNTMQRGAGSAMVTLNGGTLDYAASNHGHMGNITLQNGALWTATGGGGYNGENMQFNGTVTVSGTSASTIGPFTQGLALNGNREFNVANVTGDNNTDLTVSAELENNDSGAGDGIIKTGAGTMRFTGSGKSYSGATTVNAGKLLVNTSLRNTSGVTVGTGAVVEMGATNIFVAGHGTALADSRVLTANGGTLLMNGAFNARFGNVTLNDGATWTSNRSLAAWDALMANTSAGAATVTVGGTGASTMNGSGGIHLKGVQNFDVGNVSGDAGGDLFVNMILANAGNAGGTGGINKLGAGTMVIQKDMTYTGGTTISGGTLSIGNGGTTGSLSGAITNNSALVVHRTNTITLNNNISGTGSLTLKGNGNSASHVNVTGNNSGYTGNITIDGARAAINMNGGNRVGSGTITVAAGGQIYLTGGTISNDVFLNGNGTTEGAGQLGAVRLENGTVLSGTTTLQSDSRLTTWSGAQARVTGPIVGSSNLEKTGTGTLTLTGSNTYTGTTTINAGTLQVGDGGATGTLGSGNVVNNGTLRFNRSGTYAVSNDITGTGNIRILNSGSNNNITLSGAITANNLNFDRPGSTSMQVTLSGNSANVIDSFTTSQDGHGTLVLAKPDGVDALSGAVHVGNGYASRLKIQLGNNNQIADSSVVNMYGFNGAYGGNSYFQLMGYNETIEGLGSGSTTAHVQNGAATASVLTLAGVSSHTLTNTRIENGSSGTLSLVKNGAGTQTFSGGTANYTGTTTVNSGRLTLANVSGFRSATTVASGAILEVANSGTRNMGNGASISGAGTLLKTGTGVAVFGGNNYSTTVSMGSGALIDIQGGSIKLDYGYNKTSWNANLADMNIASGATFDIWDYGWSAGAFVKIDALTGGGSIVRGISGTTTGGLEIGVDNGSGTFSGVIGVGVGTSEVAIKKSGSGTQTFTGANTYSGTTTVNGGTLALASSYSHTGTGAYVVQGGTLNIADGVDIGGHAMTINLGGVISPGNSPGTAITGPQTWGNGGSYLWEINDSAGTQGDAVSGWDLLDITGVLDLTSLTNGGFTIDITSLTTGNIAGEADGFDIYINADGIEDYSFVIASASGGITGFDEADFLLDTSAFANGLTDDPYWDWQILTDGNDLVLEAYAVPEPSSALLIVLGGIGFIFRRKKI